MWDNLIDKTQVLAVLLSSWAIVCHGYYVPIHQNENWDGWRLKRIPDIQSIAFCSPEFLSLSCPSNKAFVFHRALYYRSRNGTPKNSSNCFHTASIPFQQTFDLYADFNARCSFRNSCYFNFTDYFQRSSHGIFSLEYNCVKDSHVLRTCGLVLHEDSGYIASPGYPDFYPRLKECQFTVLADYHQIIEMVLLDLHLKGIIYPASSCSDTLVISERNNRIIRLCDSANSSITLLTKSNFLKITINSLDLYHRRGFLAYFKKLGCIPPPPPVDGYLVKSNKSHVLYTCCIGYVFPDSLARHRLLYCEDDNHWNLHVPNCHNVQELLMISNSSATLILMSYMNISKSNNPKIQGVKSYTWDTLVPLAVILILVIGNTLLILTIIIIRRRMKHKENPKATPGLFFLNGTIQKM